LADGGELVLAHAVIDKRAPALPFEQTGIMQHFQVVADGRLGQLEGFDHVAGALAAGLGFDQPEELDAGRVAEGAEHSGKSFGVGPVDRLIEGRAARRFGPLEHRGFRHASILTHVDRSGNIDLYQY